MKAGHIARAIMGVIGLLAIFVIWATTSAGATASAVQVTQIYTQGAFAAVIAIGLVICTYVIARPD